MLPCEFVHAAARQLADVPAHQLLELLPEVGLLHLVRRLRHKVVDHVRENGILLLALLSLLVVVSQLLVRHACNVRSRPKSHRALDWVG